MLPSYSPINGARAFNNDLRWCLSLIHIQMCIRDRNDEICGYEFVHMGKFMDEIKKGTDANEALKKVTGTYGRVTAEQGAVKHIDPRHE